MIQSGVYEAVRGSGDDEKLLFKYEEAGAFGELALMYNSPRAATVRVSHSLPRMATSHGVQAAVTCHPWCCATNCACWPLLQARPGLHAHMGRYYECFSWTAAAGL